VRGLILIFLVSGGFLLIGILVGLILGEKSGYWKAMKEMKHNE